MTEGQLIGWLVGFYNISTLVSYLMPNLIYTYILDIYDLCDIIWYLTGQCHFFKWHMSKFEPNSIISLQITVILVKLLLQIFKTMKKSKFSPFCMKICQWKSCAQSGCSVCSQPIKYNNALTIQSIVYNCFNAAKRSFCVNIWQ